MFRGLMALLAGVVELFRRDGRAAFSDTDEQVKFPYLILVFIHGSIQGRSCCLDAGILSVCNITLG